MRTVCNLERDEKTSPPEDVESLPAGMFCEKCSMAIFPELEELESLAVLWLGEHMDHGTIWAVVETPDGEIVSNGIFAREH